MHAPYLTAWRRIVPLMVGGALVMTLNVMAIFSPDPNFIFVALTVTGIFALFGIGFGIWSIRKGLTDNDHT